jgi:2',3'-cyclic-nucleotide 2'-phosphodiesterase (5'-nucleotidase family)
MEKTFWLILGLDILLFTILTSSFYFTFTPPWSSPSPSPPSKHDKLLNLTIIHTNDVHSHYDQINAAATDCTKEQYKKKECYGGTARHKTIIDELRKKNKNTLLMDAGDQFQGSLYYTYYNGGISTKVLNLLEYNITGIGNHEFDRGPKALATHLSRLNMPIVCANINTTLDRGLRRTIKPYHIFEEYNLAVIGYITDLTGSISNAGPDLEFYDPIPIVQHYVNELHDKGIKRIFTLSHNGYGPDKKLAAKTHGIAVHIGGHSHTFLANDTKLPDYDLVEGPYPTVVNNSKGEETLVVQAFWSGKYIGHLDVSLDKEGRLRNYTGGPILVDQSISQDRKVQKLVEEWREPFEGYIKTVVGSAKDEFDQITCQSEECSMGNLITDAMIASRNHANAALINSGSIRAGLLRGNITLANIFTVLPFENYLVEISLTGKNITDMLEGVVSRWKNKISKERITSFIQVSGLRFKYNSTKPIYDRISEIQISNTGGIFEFINLNKTYKIVTDDFVSHGGDGILPYPINVVPLEKFDLILKNYIHTQRTVIPYTDNRIEDLAPKLYIDEPINIHEPIHFGYENSLDFQDEEIIIPQFHCGVKTKSNTFLKFILKAFCGPFC